MKHLLLIVLCFYSCVSFCQTQTNNRVDISLFLPEVALFSITPISSNINLSFNSPTQAGQSLQNNQADSSKWLNFTSAVRNGQSRRITAQVTSGVFSSGYAIVLATTKFGGTGNLGNVIPLIELSSNTQNIVSGIGGAFTGAGSSGYNLKYSLRIKDYSLLRAGINTPYTITFTLTDN